MKTIIRVMTKSKEGYIYRNKESIIITIVVNVEGSGTHYKSLHYYNYFTHTLLLIYCIEAIFM